MGITNTIQAKLVVRRATSSIWTSVNPVLLAGEMGYEVNTRRIKIGNGTTPWNSLGYIEATSTAFDDFVKKFDNQTIDGIKTFLQSPLVPLTPTQNAQATSKVYVDDLVDDLIIILNNKANTADVYLRADLYTKSETNSLLSAKANTADVWLRTQTYNQAEINGFLALKANTADVYLKTETYSQAEIDGFLAVLATSDNVYLKTETYNQAEIDGFLALKANAADVYTQLQIDGFLGDKADAADIYTQLQIDGFLALKANAADVYTQLQIDGFLVDKANAADVYLMTETYNQAEVNNLLSFKADSTDVYLKTETYSQIEIDGFLGDKADTVDVVTLSGSQTITSEKDFTVFPLIPLGTPPLDQNPVSKSYLDTVVAGIETGGGTGTAQLERISVPIDNKINFSYIVSGIPISYKNSKGVISSKDEMTTKNVAGLAQDIEDDFVNLITTGMSLIDTSIIDTTNNALIVSVNDNDISGSMTGEFIELDDTVNRYNFYFLSENNMVSGAWTNVSGAYPHAGNIHRTKVIESGVAISAGVSGQAARSTDYGTTWTSLSIGPTDDYTALDMNEAGTAIIGTITGDFYRSTDYGANWTNIATNTPGTTMNAIYSVSINDYGNGVACLEYDAAVHLIYTNDNGDSWTEITNAPLTTVFALAKITNDGIIVFSGADTIVSDNLGESWINVTSTQPFTINDISVTKESIFAVGNTGGVAIFFFDGDWDDRTTDFQTNHGSYNLKAISMRESGVGLIGAEGGVLLRTSDFANSWTDITTDYPNSNHINDISISYDGVGIIVGDSGEVARIQHSGIIVNTINRENYALGYYFGETAEELAISAAKRINQLSVGTSVVYTGIPLLSLAINGVTDLSGYTITASINLGYELYESSFIIGEKVYVGNDGKLTQDKNSISSDEYEVIVGYAQNINIINVNVSYPKKNNHYTGTTTVGIENQVFGDYFYDTSTDDWFKWNGTTWIQL